MATTNSWSNAISNAAITLNSTTNAINISSDASATAVNIATGGAAKVVTMGSTNGASQLALQYGTADFSLASATGNVIVALDTGEVTKPLQPAFLANLASDDDNVTGTGTLWQLGSSTALTKVFDQNTDFNTNGTFTAPVTGKYSLTAKMMIAGIVAASYAQLRIDTSNGNFTYYYGSPTVLVAGGTYLTYMITVLADMDAADTSIANINISGEAGDVIDVQGNGPLRHTCFSGFLVC